MYVPRTDLYLLQKCAKNAEIVIYIPENKRENTLNTFVSKYNKFKLIRLLSVMQCSSLIFLAQ